MTFQADRPRDRTKETNNHMATPTMSRRKTTPAPAPATGVKRLSILKTMAPAAAAPTATAYPRLPEDGEVGNLVTTVRDLSAEFDAVKGSLDEAKGLLVEKATAFYYPHYHGRTSVESSIEAVNDKGERALITFQSRYKQADEAEIERILGMDRLSRYFREAFSLKIDGDKIPTDKAEEVLRELSDVLTKHGCPDAISVKAGVIPTDEWHTQRHLVATVAENLALDAAAPMVKAVKTKGVK